MRNPSRLIVLTLVAVFPLVSRGDPSPTTQPQTTQPAADRAAVRQAGGKYRLTRQGVAGLQSPQFVFIIVTPEGYPWVATSEKLQWMIEQAVPAKATLEWSPGCKRTGGEPLE